MEWRRFAFLTDKQKRELDSALKEDKVIIIKGPQGPTGKSTVKNKLKDMGYKVYEEYEIYELKLNTLISNPTPELEKEIR